jgi:hypothetical protein
MLAYWCILDSGELYDSAQGTAFLVLWVALSLWLANCYFAYNSLRFPALLPFFNASSPSRGKHDGR